MKKIRWSLLLFIILALFLSACGSGGEITSEATEAPELEETELSEPEPETGPTRSVRVVDSAFEGREITVSVGTTVVWTHSGNFPHTVTADDSSFDSGNMASGNAFSITYNEVGTFPYYCAYHGGPNGSGMSGVVIVTE
ncbi:MAG: hypothetical protein FVQ83_14440 [Chloroflexi bacterium]|nr:hypothetical protein [Chloroflexota bacterium]